MMKATLLVLLTALTFTAQAKEFKIRGPLAKSAMQAIVLNNGGQFAKSYEQSKADGVFETGASFYCYSLGGYQFPAGWANNDQCALGSPLNPPIGGGITPTQNGETLAIVFSEYGRKQIINTFPGWVIDSVTCTYKVAREDYRCTITVQ